MNVPEKKNIEESDLLKFTNFDFDLIPCKLYGCIFDISNKDVIGHILKYSNGLANLQISKLNCCFHNFDFVHDYKIILMILIIDNRGTYEFLEYVTESIMFESNQVCLICDILDFAISCTKLELIKFLVNTIKNLIIKFNLEEDQQAIKFQQIIKNSLSCLFMYHKSHDKIAYVKYLLEEGATLDKTHDYANSKYPIEYVHYKDKKLIRLLVLEMVKRNMPTLSFWQAMWQTDEKN